MRNKNLLIGIVLLVVMFNSIVYSALNSEMFINGDAHIRVDKDIRITDVKVLEQTNGSYETYNSDYSKNTTSMQVTLPGSDSVMIYEVTITNKGDIDYEVSSIVEESYSNSNIKYELIDIENGTVIDRGTTHTFKIKFITTENNPDNKTTLVLKYTFKEWMPTLYNMVAHKSRGLDTDIDFGVAPTKETSGIYKMNSTKDDNNPVYYYRGIIDNNNVNFAGFCWKIVRTTSTGGVKLIYNGTPESDGSCDNTSNASFIGNSIYTSNGSINGGTTIEDVDYLYNNGTDSEIKKAIDKWYSEHMTEYTNMLEDTVWCSDRSIYNQSENNVYFGAYGRNYILYKPSLECPNKADQYTINSNNGNGLLKYPVALLTADEVTLAGNSYNVSMSNNYLDVGYDWWTMSPSSYRANLAYVMCQRLGGSLLEIYVHPSSTRGYRPSISLINGTMIKEGNGSVTSPYKLVEDKITKEWTFDYTGGEQAFKVPYDGIYKLEVWGAQGGTYSEVYYGGYGAYSTGNIDLIKGDNLYINVGGNGTNVCDRNYSNDGTYNGGGGAKKDAWTGTTTATECKGTGGGSTHIATMTGQLKQLENDLQAIYIAAAGGGSAEYFYVNLWNGVSSSYCSGGSGGGITGNLAICHLSENVSSAVNEFTKATQNTGGIKRYGSNYLYGSFGVGASGYSGGGSGYYGGAGGHAGAGGGSSYIGNSLLNNKVMYCYNCEESNEESTKTISTTNISEEPISNYAKKGAGYAKITLITKK